MESSHSPQAELPFIEDVKFSEAILLLGPAQGSATDAPNASASETPGVPLKPRPVTETTHHNANEPDHDHENKAERELFIQDLYEFMELKGHAITKVPSLGFQVLDLYRLYKIVIGRGGMDEVTKQQAWKSVYLELGIPTMSTSASYNTRTNYKKYLYLYELEHFELESKGKREDIPFKYVIDDYVKIESTIQEQVYYAQIMKRRFQKGNMYYVHYKGWSTSHDEWMPEYALTQLSEEEAVHKEDLSNPPPTRSSKSNYLIFDPNVNPNKVSPKKKTKSSPSMSSSSKKSHSSGRKSSMDEWMPTVMENVTSPESGKIKFKLPSPRSMDTLVASAESDHESRQKNGSERERIATHSFDAYADADTDVGLGLALRTLSKEGLKGLQIAQDHDSYYGATTDEDEKPLYPSLLNASTTMETVVAPLLRAMATASESGSEMINPLANEQQGQHAMTSSKRRRLDPSRPQHEGREEKGGGYRSTRQSAQLQLPSRNTNTVSAVVAPFSLSATTSAHHHHHHHHHHHEHHASSLSLSSSFQHRRSTLPPPTPSPTPTSSHSRSSSTKMMDNCMDDSMDHLREKEKIEREKFNKLPFKPDVPPITPYNIHSSQLSHDPIHGFLEGVDFKQAIQAIESASIKYHPIDVDYFKSRTSDARTSSLDRLSPELSNASDPEEISLLEIKASAEATEKRLEEIKSQYLLYTNHLEELNRKNIVPLEPAVTVSASQRERRR